MSLADHTYTTITVRVPPWALREVARIAGDQATTRGELLSRLLTRAIATMRQTTTGGAHDAARAWVDAHMGYGAHTEVVDDLARLILYWDGNPYDGRGEPC